MSTAFSAAEAQAARDYAAANSGRRGAPPTPTHSPSTAASLARALSSAATAIAGDISLVAGGIEAAEGEHEQREREQRGQTPTEGETEVPDEEDREDEEGQPRPPEAAGDAEANATTPQTSPAPRDKLSFLVGVLVFGMSAFYLGAFPLSFVRCYIFLAAVLLGTRYFVYRSTRQHLFLLDLCYIVNALWVLHLVVLPRSLFLRRCLFALSSGPLMGSVGGERICGVFFGLRVFFGFRF